MVRIVADSPLSTRWRKIKILIERLANKLFTLRERKSLEF